MQEKEEPSEAGLLPQQDVFAELFDLSLQPKPLQGPSINSTSSLLAQGTEGGENIAPNVISLRSVQSSSKTVAPSTAQTEYIASATAQDQSADALPGQARPQALPQQTAEVGNCQQKAQSCRHPASWGPQTAVQPHAKSQREEHAEPDPKADQVKHLASQRPAFPWDAVIDLLACAVLQNAMSVQSCC